MGWSAKLVLDPDGDAHTRTLAGPVDCVLPDTKQQSRRQTQAGYGWARSVSRRALGRRVGTLRLELSLADRQWLRSHATDHVMSGDTVRVYPDSTDSGTYRDYLVAGKKPKEDYQPVWEGLEDLWRLELPVVVLQEVTS